MGFGAPQDRVRAIIVASLSGPVHLAEPGTAHQTIADILDPDDHPENIWRRIAAKPKRMRPLIWALTGLVLIWATWKVDQAIRRQVAARRALETSHD